MCCREYDILGKINWKKEKRNDNCFDRCFIYINIRKLHTLIDFTAFPLIANGSFRLAVSSQTVVTTDARASQMINCCLVVTVDRCAILVSSSSIAYNSEETAFLSTTASYSFILSR